MGSELGVFEACLRVVWGGPAGGGRFLAECRRGHCLGTGPPHSLCLPSPSRPVGLGTLPEAEEQDTLRKIKIRVMDGSSPDC